MVSVLDELDGLLDRLTDADLSRGADLVRLHRGLARLDAITTRNVGVWDASREWQEDRARTGAAWLAVKCGVPMASARRRLRLARELRHLPVTEDAWLAGDIESAHVAAIAGVRNERTAEVLERDEKLLVDDARTMRYSGFSRSLSYWLQLADPDGDEDRARKQTDGRRFDFSQTFQGAWVGDVWLDPINGTIVSDAMRRIDEELFGADWAEAKQRVGRDPLTHELQRTPKQRRADALVEMAMRAMTAPKGGRRPEPLFTVFVGYETFAGRICELANGTVVSPGSLVPYLDEPWVERVVFDSPSRVIDVGVQRRCFEGGTRRAVQLRDLGECFEDICEERGDHLQIDHTTPVDRRRPDHPRQRTCRLRPPQPVTQQPPTRPLISEARARGERTMTQKRCEDDRAC
jgi:hypothetical protein